MGNRSSSHRQTDRSREFLDENGGAPMGSSPHDLGAPRSSNRWTSRSFAEGRSMDRYFSDPAYHRGAREDADVQAFINSRRGNNRRRHDSRLDTTNYYSNDYRRALKLRKAKSKPKMQKSSSTGALDYPLSSTEEDAVTATVGSPGPHNNGAARGKPRLRAVRASTEVIEAATHSSEEVTQSLATSPPPELASSVRVTGLLADAPTATAAAGAEAELTGPPNNNTPRSSREPESQESAAAAPQAPPNGLPTVLPSSSSSPLWSDPARPADNSNPLPLGGEFGTPLGRPALQYEPALEASRMSRLSNPATVAAPRQESDLLSIATLPQLVDDINSPFMGTDDATTTGDHDRREPHHQHGHHQHNDRSSVRSGGSSRHSYAFSDTSSRRSVRTVAHRGSHFHSVAEPWVAMNPRRGHRDAAYVVSVGHASDDTASLADTVRTTGHRHQNTRQSNRNTTTSHDSRHTRSGDAVSSAGDRRTAARQRPARSARTRNAASTAAVQRAIDSARTRRRRGPPNDWTGAQYTGNTRQGGDSVGPILFFGGYIDPTANDYGGGDYGGTGSFADVGI